MSQFIDYSLSFGSKWNRSEDILLERAILIFPEETPNRWYKIVTQILGKSPMDVLEHYIKLIQDIDAIDFGSMDQYIPDRWDLKEEEGSTGSKVENKKGTPWTEEKHVLFLEGLVKYGKGDWKSISRNFVITRMPSQVASHAQKYFARQRPGNMGKKRKRTSIHDITTDDLPPLGGVTP
ncbi:transcription factor DIVARICATA [Vitis vinifera]|nr:transcription factor DIVARICATA [Vitis vinifera]|eukprot:XP_002264395.2 PREDICTED: transcription factor DIVARICATA-like [Vitis vinifera]